MTAATALHRDYDSAPAVVVDPITTHLSPVLAMLPDLFAPASPARTLQTVVDLARRAFGGDGAGIILAAEDGGFGAATASGSDAVRADVMQVEDHQGPAFGAIAGWQPVVSAELRFDSRWRFWGPKAADLGFRSVMSLPLADGDSFGALTLYSRRPSYFSTGSATDELTFAQQASYAIAVAVEREQLVRARDSRGIVGQAQGILMERYQTTGEQAFAVLRRYSSHVNQKLRLVAEQLVRDHNLPDLERIGLPALRAI
jgi:GAF domain-containing protein